MHRLQIHLTDEQYALITHIAEQEGEAIEEIIPNLIDEYVILVRRMGAVDLLSEVDTFENTMIILFADRKFAVAGLSGAIQKLVTE